MRREFRFAISLAAAGVLSVLAFTPEDVRASAPAVCLFRNLLGWECFGCGMTRAIAATLHGDPEAAWNLNRGVVVALPVLLFALFQGVAILFADAKGRENSVQDIVSGRRPGDGVHGREGRVQIEKQHLVRYTEFGGRRRTIE